MRYRGLFANTFHADEALFATWARHIAVWRDPLLLTQAVDKPPLLFYLQALFYPLFGPVEWAARMPAFVASLLLIPLTGRLALRLTGDRTAAVVAALLVAVAPLAVQFSATAFSDPLLTLWLVAACYAIAAPARPTPRHGRRSSFLAGLLWGLALATKYQAALFLPLLLVVGWLSGRTRGEWARAALGAAVVVAAVLGWQWLRLAEARPTDTLIALQWANIGGIRPARSWELWSRLADMAHLWQLALGWPMLAAVAAALVGLWCGRAARPVEWTLGLFLPGYALLHWLWAVPVWDRYWLPVLPLAAILVGRGVSVLMAIVAARRPWRYAVTVAAALLLLAHLPVGFAARNGRYPIGGSPTADGGAAEVAVLLRDAPYGTVLYDHWHSWQWNYHLFDGRVYVSWFPHAEALLDDLAVFAGRGPARYVALPNSAAAWPVARRLLESGYTLERVAGQSDAAGVTLFRIVAEAAE